MKRLLSTALATLIAMSAFSTCALATTDANAKTTAVEQENIEYNEHATYSEYLESITNIPSAAADIVLDATKLTAKTAGVQLKENYDGVAGTAIYTGEEDSITFTFDVPGTAVYNIFVEYHTEEGKNVSIQRGFQLNGDLPFDRAGQVVLNRVWNDEREENGGFKKDAFGNDIRPSQVEDFCWTSMYVYDPLGYNPDPMKFAIMAGTNTLTVASVKEPVTIGKVILKPVLDLKSYADVANEYDAQGLKKYAGEELIFEAENAKEKSDQTLYPSADTSSVSTSPYENYKQIINMVGGTRWQSAQQSVTWNVNVPEDGLYKLNIKFRKNLYSGMLSSRMLFVNGEIPFKEAEAVSFAYEADWAISTVKDEQGNECYIRLNKGDNEIMLMVTQGVQGQYVQKATTVLAELNAMYRKIIMITGSDPDKNTDYRLEKLIPDVVDGMKTQADALQSIVDGITAYTGQTGSDFSSFTTLTFQMNSFYEEPELITRQLSMFKTNIGSLGTWINDAGNAPLEVDYISVSAPDGDEDSVKDATKGFFAGLAFEFNRFIGSFIIDYDSIGNMNANPNKEETVDVWLSSGRDQLQTLRAMINDKYTKETGNEINLSLVNISALLSATVAGIGPDVAIGTPKAEPVNFALRGAAVDLTQFNTYEDVAKRFSGESLIPARYDDGKKVGVYGLPDAQIFQVMFYRKDILSQLGLNVPKTWDDVINTITVLNKNNLEFGIPISTTLDPTGGVLTFYALLLQNGGKLYLDDQTGTDLFTQEATNAFKIWTNFYSNYELPVSYDFQNRFRTGEMPIGISSYTLYNTLKVAAPEIEGMWDFTTIPGTIQEDGTLDVSNALSPTYTIMLSQCDKKELAWQFMDWWTSTDAQAEYGQGLECVMGPSARYNTANKDAFARLPWTKRELTKLNAQLENAHAIPEIPGSYFLNRHINNAFYSVVNQDTDPKDTLMDYAKTINEEIYKKRKEFGLNTGDNQ